MRTRTAALLLALSALAPAREAEELDLRKMFHDSIPPSPFAAVFYRYADAMLEHGRDGEGPEKSGLFLSALDRKSLAPLKTRPPAPLGVRPEQRPGPPAGPLAGANLGLDQDLLRLLYFLKGLSGEDRYPEAADRALGWFLRNTGSSATGLYPWGNELSWNIRTDEVAPGGATAVHELRGPWLLWRRCFELAPEESGRFARALREHHVDPRSGALASRAGFLRALPPPPPGGSDSPRQAGFFLRTWAEAWAETRDREFLEAIDALLARSETRRHGATTAGSTRASSFLSLAIDADGAARRVPEPLRTRLARLAAREDEVFLAGSHPLKAGEGFATGTGDTTPLWDPGRGGETTARVGMMCVSRYENTGKVGYRDLIVRAADAYLDALPREGSDAWPGTFGQAISLELAAFRVTAREEYHRRAFRLGEIAVERFFAASPLPRQSPLGPLREHDRRGHPRPGPRGAPPVGAPHHGGAGPGEHDRPLIRAADGSPLADL